MLHVSSQAFGNGANPLESENPRVWDALLESLGPASLLVVIESRMSALLRSRMRAEDVLQDVLLRLWRDRSRIEWRGTGPFRNFVLQAIDNRVKDLAAHERAQKRGGGLQALVSQLGAADEDASEFPPGVQTTTPSRIAMVREEAEAMRAALDGLPEELREIVRLRLFEEVTTEEVAESLGLGLSAVKHRFRKGAELYRERLRNELATRTGSSLRKP